MTNYVVLMNTDGGWVQQALVEASSAANALKVALRDIGVQGSEYVAIPHRSFTPMRVKVVNVERISVT